MSNSANSYQPSVIEAKWQKYWLDHESFIAQDDSAKPKYYCLDMFPYPSAQGLHVGHPEGYTATDIVSRYRRMKGSAVLHPMGWDAFGLPAENYAIKTGVHPDNSTHQNIKTFMRQIRALGFSYDWRREVDTSSPEYYKWTQWMFLEMYQHGLAYRKKAKVNWCNSCQTVLANEQVVDGKCERSQDQVIQKDLAQWFFKITAYADRLLQDLDAIDWPEPIKLMQRNWIGRSEGAELQFIIPCTCCEPHTQSGSLHCSAEKVITVFTTRPDTLFGATYLVLAPEHPLITSLTTSEQHTAIAAYINEVAKKTELERTSMAKDKTGVFTGSYAQHPLTGEPMPIWIADYVLSTYGSGAIMAVPAHDERDWEFAHKFHLPIKQVITSPDAESNTLYTGSGQLIHSAAFDGLDNETAKWAITKKVGGKKVVKYKLRDWLISRQRYWGAPIPMVYDPSGEPHPIKPEYLPLLLPTDVDYMPKGTAPLGSSVAYRQLAEQLYGPGWHFEIDTMDTFVCSSWYFLRYCDPHNNERFADPAKLKHWLPVDMYVGGAEHAVLHLLYARFFHKALQDFGHIPSSVGPEPFAALRNQGMILGADHQKMSKSRGNVVNPDDIVNEFGADTMRLYEMFIGPFEDVKPWQPDSIRGVHRFLDRVFRLASNIDTTASVAPTTERIIHLTTKLITEHIEQFRFNTAIAQLMIYANHLGELDTISQMAFERLVVLLSPFAPHLSAELWDRLGHSDGVWEQAWPTFDATKLEADTITIVVQVNGKVRDQLTIATHSTEAAIIARAQSAQKVQTYLAGKVIQKTIYVPNKLVSFVV